MSRTAVLASTLLVLGGWALWVDQPWRGDSFDLTEARVAPLVPELDQLRSEIGSIRLRGPEGVTHLVLVGREWVVEQRGGHPVDRERLLYLVDRLAAVTTRDIVSVNPAKHATYGVTAEDGIHIRFASRAGEPIVHLIGGSLREQDLLTGGNVLMEFYVRRADRDEVVLAAEFLPPSTDPADWIDGRIFPELAWEDLRRIRREVVDGDRRDGWELLRRELEPQQVDASAAGVDHRWEMLAPRAGQASLFAGDSFCFSFAGLDAADVVTRLEPDPGGGFPPEAATSFGPVIDRFEAEDRVRGRRYRVELGRPRRDGRRHVWAGGSPWVYLLDEQQVRQLRQPASAMLEE